MLVVAVPDVVVRDLVQVSVEPVVVHVHVGNEESWSEPSVLLPN